MDKICPFAIRRMRKIIEKEKKKSPREEPGFTAVECIKTFRREGYALRMSKMIYEAAINEMIYDATDEKFQARK